MILGDERWLRWSAAALFWSAAGSGVIGCTGVTGQESERTWVGGSKGEVAAERSPLEVRYVVLPDTSERTGWEAIAALVGDSSKASAAQWAVAGPAEVGAAVAGLLDEVEVQRRLRQQTHGGGWRYVGNFVRSGSVLRVLAIVGVAGALSLIPSNLFDTDPNAAVLCPGNDPSGCQWSWEPVAVPDLGAVPWKPESIPEELYELVADQISMEMSPAGIGELLALGDFLVRAQELREPLSSPEAEGRTRRVFQKMPTVVDELALD